MRPWYCLVLLLLVIVQLPGQEYFETTFYATQSEDPLDSLCMASQQESPHCDELKAKYAWSPATLSGQSKRSGKQRKKFNKRIKAVQKEAAHYTLQDRERILEIGFGNSFFSRAIWFNLQGIEYYGSEIDSTQLYYGASLLHFSTYWTNKLAAHDNTVRFLVATDTTTGAGNLQFDKIVLRNTFHHFAHPDRMMESIRGQLKPGGRIIIREFFSDTQKAETCSKAYTQSAFEALLLKQGLVIESREVYRVDRHRSYFVYVLFSNKQEQSPSKS